MSGEGGKTIGIKKPEFSIDIWVRAWAAERLARDPLATGRQPAAATLVDETLPWSRAGTVIRAAAWSARTGSFTGLALDVRHGQHASPISGAFFRAPRR